MKSRVVILAALFFVMAQAAFGTSFIVPTDAELVDRSPAIVIGVVEGAQVQDAAGVIETVYEIRIERSLKGRAASREELLRVVSPGGVMGERGVIVPSAARFEQGQRVLLFLTRDGRGRWTPTDLTLGRFEFVTSTAGEHLLVRDMENVVGWDHAGRVHHEKVRRETGFLRFVEDHVAGHGAAGQDYLVDATAVTLSTDSSNITSNAAPFPAATYTDWVNNEPVRWPNISAGVNFYKRSDQNISGASDGGVSVIQNGLAAWNNECGSVINLIYAGQIAKASANHDGTNVVEFNDPQERISGAWTGSGTIAITFISFAGEHTFLSQTWLNITDADVVFQNGYPATNAAFATAMTHELGHAIGWRHSNQDYATGGACNSGVEECTSAAIMNSVVNANYGYTLQPWDVNAAQSVYPGGTCGTPCTPPSITAQPTSRTIASGQSTTLSVTATGTTPLSYQWYRGSSGDTSQPVSGGTGPSITVAPTATTSYWVRVSNSCGSVNSATATVTVSVSTPPPTSSQDAYMDFNGDGRSEIIWRNNATGQFAMWDMNGRTVLNGAVFTTLTDANWKVLGFGDFDDDGDDDVFFRNAVNGGTAMWLMSGRTITLNAPSTAVPDMNWQMHAIGDFNGDGKDELIWRNTSSGQVAMWEMNGVTLLNGAVFATVSDRQWQIQLAGDFNGDGKDELIWRNTSTGQLAMWEMNGRTLVNGASFATVADLTWQIAGVGDFNGDNKSDLLWRKSDTGDVAMWEMSGRTVLNGASILRVGLEWQLERAGDFNADGTDEIIWWNRNTGDVAMWEMRGHTIVNGSTFYHLPSLNWRMQPRGGPRPALNSQ